LPWHGDEDDGWRRGFLAQDARGFAARNVEHADQSRNGAAVLKIAVVAAVGAIIGIVVFWNLTAPATVPGTALLTYKPDVENGEKIFDIGGCASCHASPNKDPGMVDRTRLGGGLALKSPFGTFYVPNISPDPEDGIGKWGEADFVTALWEGTSPRGYHLFPAFPYTSYRLMKLDDVRDLFAYLRALPPVSGKVREHDLPFPLNIRRLVGGWKLLFLRGWLFEPDQSKSAQWNRGAYLVNGPGHCAECHSPRNFLGAIMDNERFTGGPAADGNGWVPNITSAGLQHWSKDHIAWSEKDIASFLADGMNPAGDFAGGAMADVIRNTALLSVADRAAIATYIASLPPKGQPKSPLKK
jgi:mono/diheme cytochrome c family protein